MAVAALESGTKYLSAQEAEANRPSLFDLLEVQP